MKFYSVSIIVWFLAILIAPLATSADPNLQKTTLPRCAPKLSSLNALSTYVESNPRQFLDSSLMNTLYPEFMAVGNRVASTIDGAEVRELIQNRIATHPSLQLANVKDVDQIYDLFQSTTLAEKGTTTGGFLTSSTTREEILELIDNEVVIKQVKDGAIQALAVLYGSKSAYGRKVGGWIDLMNLSDSAFNYLKRDNVITVRAIVARPSAGRAMLHIFKFMESLSVHASFSLLAKVSISPLNRQAFELDLAMGCRIVGNYTSPNGQLWAVIVRNY